MPPKRKAKAAPDNSMPLGRAENKENINQEADNDVQKNVVAQLEEQIRALTLENQNLRRELEQRQQPEKASPANTPVKTPKNLRNRRLLSAVVATPQRKHSSPAVTLSKPKEKGCSCAGNCSTRRCGCVKQGIYCAADICKCSDLCKNMKPDSDAEDNHEGDDEDANNDDDDGDKDANGDDDGDDEDANDDDDDDEPAKSNTNNKNITITKSIFDPDESGSSGSSAASPENIKQENSSNHSYNTSTQTDDEIINPMKPTRQLARSPLGSVKQPTNLDVRVPHNDTVHPLNLSLPKTEVKIPEDLENAEVADWEKHQAELIPCSKCQRRFFPSRVDVHEKSCLQI